MRLFRCHDCGHKMRFGAKRCGKCHYETPVWNHRFFAWLLVLLLGVIAFALLPA